MKHLIFVRDSQQQERLLEHFITVNRVTREQAEEYLSDVYQEQQRLNQVDWIINYGKYNWQVPSVATMQQRQMYANYNHPRYSEPAEPVTS